MQLSSVFLCIFSSFSLESNEWCHLKQYIVFKLVGDGFTPFKNDLMCFMEDGNSLEKLGISPDVANREARNSLNYVTSLCQFDKSTADCRLTAAGGKSVKLLINLEGNLVILSFRNLI